MAASDDDFPQTAALPFEVLLSFVSSWHWPIRGRCQGILAVAMLGATSVLNAYGLKPDRFGASIGQCFCYGSGRKYPAAIVHAIYTSYQLPLKKENAEHGGEQWRITANDVRHGGRIL
jgi:hypothetical protein